MSRLILKLTSMMICFCFSDLSLFSKLKILATSLAGDINKQNRQTNRIISKVRYSCAMCIKGKQTVNNVR